MPYIGDYDLLVVHVGSDEHPASEDDMDNAKQMCDQSFAGVSNIISLVVPQNVSIEKNGECVQAITKIAVENIKNAVLRINAQCTKDIAAIKKDLATAQQELSLSEERVKPFQQALRIIADAAPETMATSLIKVADDALKNISLDNMQNSAIVRA